jgi:hypothetical protein
MWFINFVLAAAVLVTALVLGSAAYLEQVESASRMVGAISAPVPLPTPRPKPVTHKPVTQVHREAQEVVTAPQPAVAVTKPARRTQARPATW